MTVKRWASSRMRWTSCSASESYGRRTGSGVFGIKSSSSRFAMEMTGACTLSSSRTFLEDDSCPLPPSITMRSGVGHAALPLFVCFVPNLRCSLLCWFACALFRRSTLLSRSTSCRSLFRSTFLFGRRFFRLCHDKCLAGTFMCQSPLTLA